MKMVPITVNGRKLEAAEGELLIHVVRAHGISLPTLCHDDRLAPYGGCRLCVVEQVDGRGGLIPACSTPVKLGMNINTESEAVTEARRRQLQLLVLNHHMECPVCVRRSDCRLQDLIFTYGIPDDNLPFEPTSFAPQERSPVICHDPDKCIICGKCTRLCEEVQGVSAISLVSRGVGTHIATFQNQPLNCEFCGQCVNTCPVAALTARPYASNVPIWLREEVVTTCSFCSCGCQIRAQTYGGVPQTIDSAEDSRPNSGKLCAKGWLGWDLLANPDRLTKPLVRRNGALVETDWEDAFSTIAKALSRRPAQSLIGLSSARFSCEDAYLLDRFMRDFGASGLGLGPEPGLRALQTGVGPVFGRPRSTALLSDLRTADLVVVLRADPTASHPLVKTELVQRLIQDSKPVVMSCAFPTGLADHATKTLVPAPGREADLACGLAHELHALGVLKEATQLARAPRWFESIAAYEPAVTAAATGLSVPAIRDLARRIADSRHTVFVLPTARGIAGDEAITGKTVACLVAALGTRADLLVLPERCNLQGHLDLEFGFGFGTAQQPTNAMRQTLSDDGNFLYLLGQDPVAGWPRRLGARSFFERADFIVVQDAFLTETARLADVVLPATILCERKGTVVGADGVARELKKVSTAPPGALDDGQVIRRFAECAGISLPTDDEVRKEVAHRLERARTIHADVRLSAVPRPSKESPTLALTLNASPQLFHSGNVTQRSHMLSQLGPRTSLHISPDEAAERGITDGDAVRVSSNGNDVLMRACLDDAQRRGVVRMPWNTRNDGAAALIDAEDEVIEVKLRRSS